MRVKTHNISEKHSYSKDENRDKNQQFDINTNNELDNTENDTDIKIEYNDELSLIKEENCCDIKIFQKNSINEASYCSIEQESGSIQPEAKTAIQLNIHDDMKLEYHELSIEELKNDDIEIKSENEEETRKTLDETANRIIKNDEPNFSEEQNSPGVVSMQCNICEFETKNENNFISHMNEKHVNVGTIAPDLCDDKISTDRFSNEHKTFVYKKLSGSLSHNHEANNSANSKDQILLDIREYNCHLCDYKANLTSLKTHIESVHFKLNKYQCDLCNYRTNEKSRVKTHIENVHLKLKKYQCHSYNSKANRKYRLKEHIEGVHLELKYQCHLCDFEAGRRSNLKIHIESVHLKLNKYKCDLCDFKGMTEFGLKRHCKIVHLLKQKFNCSSCNYETDQKQRMRRHIEGVPLKLIKFKCNLCNFGSSNKGNLKQHIDNVHLKLKKYQCHSCNYKATKKDYLRVHIEDTHLKLKKYQCN